MCKICLPKNTHNKIGTPVLCASAKKNYFRIKPFIRVCLLISGQAFQFVKSFSFCQKLFISLKAFHFGKSLIDDCFLLPWYGVEEVDIDQVEEGQHRHLQHRHLQHRHRQLQHRQLRHRHETEKNRELVSQIPIPLPLLLLLLLQSILNFFA